MSVIKSSIDWDAMGKYEVESSNEYQELPNDYLDNERYYSMEDINN